MKNAFFSTVLSITVVGCGTKGGQGAGEAPPLTAPAVTAGSATPAPSSSSGAAAAPAGKISAQNIIFSKNAAALTDAGGTVDTTTKYLAENVVLDPGSRLRSANLQTALTTELAIDLSTALLGTWDIVNKGLSGSSFAPIGQATFQAGSKVSVKGAFAAFGVVEDVAFGCGGGEQSFEQLNSSVIMLEFGGGVVVTQVMATDADHIVMIGTGGCGANPKVSVLTRAN